MAKQMAHLKYGSKLITEKRAWKFSNNDILSSMFSFLIISVWQIDLRHEWVKNFYVENLNENLNLDGSIWNETTVINQNKIPLEHKFARKGVLFRFHATFS